jgi:hypothetical protein
MKTSTESEFYAKLAKEWFTITDVSEERTILTNVTSYYTANMTISQGSPIIHIMITDVKWPAIAGK